MKNVTTILGFWLALVPLSHAEIIAACGPLDGYSYFYEE